MATELKEFSKLCVHTLTTKPWNLKQCIKNFSAAGIHGITIWRNVLEGQNLSAVREMLNDYGMEVVSVARGGFFPSVKKEKRQAAIDDNMWAIDQAFLVRAPVLVVVCGGDPKVSLDISRVQIQDGFLRILPQAD